MSEPTSVAVRSTVKSGVVVDGVVTLLFTPSTADRERFDAVSMARQLDHVLAAGVQRREQERVELLGCCQRRGGRCSGGGI